MRMVRRATFSFPMESVASLFFSYLSYLQAIKRLLLQISPPGKLSLRRVIGSELYFSLHSSNLLTTVSTWEPGMVEFTSLLSVLPLLHDPLHGGSILLYQAVVFGRDKVESSRHAKQNSYDNRKTVAFHVFSSFLTDEGHYCVWDYLLMVEANPQRQSIYCYLKLSSGNTPLCSKISEKKRCQH